MRVPHARRQRPGGAGGQGAGEARRRRRSTKPEWRSRDLPVPHRRWDTDERGRGVADGGWIAPDVRRLLDTLAEPGWVAEDPDIHLLPHLRRACQEAGSPWTL